MLATRAHYLLTAKLWTSWVIMSIGKVSIFLAASEKLQTSVGYYYTTDLIFIIKSNVGEK